MMRGRSNVRTCFPHRQDFAIVCHRCPIETLYTPNGQAAGTAHDGRAQTYTFGVTIYCIQTAVLRNRTPAAMSQEIKRSALAILRRRVAVHDHEPVSR